MPENAEATTEKVPRKENATVVEDTITSSTTADFDDFELQVKKTRTPLVASVRKKVSSIGARVRSESQQRGEAGEERHESIGSVKVPDREEGEEEEASEDEEFKDARSTPQPSTPMPELAEPQEKPPAEPAPKLEDVELRSKITELEVPHDPHQETSLTSPAAEAVLPDLPKIDTKNQASRTQSLNQQDAKLSNGHTRGQSSKASGISEWSHQNMASKEEAAPVVEVDEWQTMPAYAPFDMYDDDNRLVAKERVDSDEEADAYAGLGGAGKGYTRVQFDEDAQSATSLDENTQYLFKDGNRGTGAGQHEDEEQRDAVSQMQATKDLLTEGQRIAYVGMTRLILSKMLHEMEIRVTTKGSKKDIVMAAEALRMWSQKMMVRLYAHMDISSAEQIMIEQLADHGVIPADLSPTLMQNARVKNPMADDASTAEKRASRSGTSPSVESPIASPRPSLRQETPDQEEVAQPPPPYQEHDGEDLPEVRTPSQLPTTKDLDIDLRWTVLCDLFLTLIADSVYDARSRVLLEKVGENMDVSWLEICRFEKRVTDALEMQQAAEKENWNEDEHKESRRKLALKKRYMMMGLATVGGSLVIGLSAGLLAPLIGAGLAAGFTTIGVAGTSGFLAGAGGAAIITSGAAASGGIIAVRAANRRTGAVKTFEYRPLHNNKRVNLIVTVSGWMTGKVDDVRLPYSTVDPIMGDIYSVLWEPEMLRSMGDTINILATEALTQGLQQVLGSTILIGLMAALQLPVVLTKLAYLIDNPWTVSLDRANAAGLILADSLIDRNLGTRPITFVGYSLGSRVIFSCLRELAKKGAYGLVQNVYLFGSPIVAKKEEYLRARSVVAGKFINGYATNDWILGYLFRLTSGGISRVAGIAPVEGIPGLENIDVTELVPGHMSYRTAMPRLLREVGFEVESDEFTEIEDPDPENHQQRQRELINEIEEARKEFEKKEKEANAKGKFGFFSRKKKAIVEKQEWETYEEKKDEASSKIEKDNNEGVLFDIDAIRAELASEHMEVRELKSTLPPMKLDLASHSRAPSGAFNPRESLRESKAADKADDLAMLKPRNLDAERSMQRHQSSEYVPGIESPPRYAPEAGDEVEMTFDTSYMSPPKSNEHLPFRSPPTRSPARSPATPPSPDPTDRSTTSYKPELKSSNTMPVSAGVGLGIGIEASNAGIDLNHNAWADDDDETFGQEKEIEMTFA